MHYITTEVPVAKAEDTGLTKEMKECMKVNLELCNSDPCLDQLLSLASFLEPNIQVRLCWLECPRRCEKKQLSQLVAERLLGMVPFFPKTNGLSKILGMRLPGTTHLLGYHLK